MKKGKRAPNLVGGAEFERAQTNLVLWFRYVLGFSLSGPKRPQFGFPGRLNFSPKTCLWWTVTYAYAQNHLILNQQVLGSTPRRVTTKLGMKSPDLFCRLLLLHQYPYLLGHVVAHSLRVPELFDGLHVFVCVGGPHGKGMPSGDSVPLKLPGSPGKG